VWKKPQNSKSIDDGDLPVDPVLLRNLASHGLTAEEMKRIMEEIRAQCWKRGNDRTEKDLG
jgi:hypothetical protein